MFAITFQLAMMSPSHANILATQKLLFPVLFLHQSEVGWKTLSMSQSSSLPSTLVDHEAFFRSSILRANPSTFSRCLSKNRERDSSSLTSPSSSGTSHIPMRYQPIRFQFILASFGYLVIHERRRARISCLHASVRSSFSFTVSDFESVNPSSSTVK